MTKPISSQDATCSVVDRTLYPDGEFEIGGISPRNMARYDRAMQACIAQELAQLEAGEQPKTETAAAVKPQEQTQISPSTTQPTAPATTETSTTTTPAPATPQTHTPSLRGIDYGYCGRVCQDESATVSALNYCQCDVLY